MCRPGERKETGMGAGGHSGKGSKDSDVENLKGLDLNW